MPRDQLGTPPVHGIVQAANSFEGNTWQNIFPDVHLSFGKLSILGTREKECFHLVVEEDETGWKGQSPLLVSFNVPACVVLHVMQLSLLASSLHRRAQGLSQAAWDLEWRYLLPSCSTRSMLRLAIFIHIKVDILLSDNSINPFPKSWSTLRSQHQLLHKLISLPPRFQVLLAALTSVQRD